MIAAIYARRSTEQHVADEAKSVTRQIDHARMYAERQGWTVDAAYTYVDDGISGAEFARRPGFRRLMAALTPRPPFQVLIMSEDSRLGREPIETLAAFKQILRAEVRVFFYLDDRELSLGTLMDDTTMFMRAQFAAEERRKASQRVKDTMRRKASAGQVTGGQCFGYDPVDVMRDDTRVPRPPGIRRRHPDAAYVDWVINEREAAVVRRIFALKAAGVAQATIVKQLNAEHAPAPRAQQGRSAGWGPASIFEALHRPLYRGDVVWGRTQKRNQWGEQCVSDRPEDEWVTVHREDLRIVPEDLSLAAEARLVESRSSMNLFRRKGATSRYLLPGLARCVPCNGGMQVRSRTRSSGPDRRFYGCTTHFHRGETVCGNGVEVPMEAMDDAVLGSISDIFTPDLERELVARLLRRSDEQATADPRAPLDAELGTVERQLANLTDAVAQGGTTPSLVERLRAPEQQRQALVDTLQTMPAKVTRLRPDRRALSAHSARCWRTGAGCCTRMSPVRVGCCASCSTGRAAHPD